MYMYNWEWRDFLNYLKCVLCHCEALMKSHHGPHQFVGNTFLPRKPFGCIAILTVKVSRKFHAGYSTSNSFHGVQNSVWAFINSSWKSLKWYSMVEWRYHNRDTLHVWLSIKSTKLQGKHLLYREFSGI